MRVPSFPLAPTALALALLPACSGNAPEAQQRFQRALDMSRLSSQADWASIALACGFYDQAHLINDFKCLSDLTPAAYVAIAGPERNRVPLTDSVR